MIEGLRSLLERARTGDVVADEVIAAAKALRAQATELPESEIRAAAAMVAELVEHLQTHRDALQARLSDTHRGRKAARGFAHLRSHRRGQRVATTV